MRQYLKLVEDIIEFGDERGDRTGTGTRAVFGAQMRFDLRKGFPLLTTKKMPWKAMVSELLWFIEGSTDERRLAEILHGTRDPEKKTIWTANAQAKWWQDKVNSPYDCGRIYGAQWRSWKRPDGTTVDQLEDLIDGIQRDPHGRRHIILGWNPGELDLMCLPPCHCLFQCFVSKGRLSGQLYQRSVDSGLGLPVNIASYALFIHMLAQVCDLEVGEFVWTGGDTHVYLDHIVPLTEQLSREPKKLPTLSCKRPLIRNIEEFRMDDFVLEGYDPHPKIEMQMSV